ncbi:uncharacterized protein MELLADRAFT_108856 [Melampsora larici-populina 98AG31]|uniref:Uncharacterized protein n=1 Tax=Melampsora larici-populina (strain 98AG31 / pathotype 3-4-7) TaxID=747676 RepID=F4RUH8_MELLP|nr:uncharacterized protein MELLADRAFT_108856 [Melampsora larici-populina 98AG31]EGG03997.1 hypothetical protein MELLADRAFT_108856 [Melampsora larici-populina 98AG31]
MSSGNRYFHPRSERDEHRVLLMNCSADAFLDPRSWWASAANIAPPLGSAFGKARVIANQANAESEEADEFLERSRPSSRLNTRDDWVTPHEPSFAEVCQEISQRFDHSMKICQPARPEEVKEAIFSGRMTRKARDTLLPSGFKTPPRKLSITQLQNYRREVCSPSASSRSRSPSSSPSSSQSSSEISSGFSYPFHTPENRIDPHRASFEEEEDSLDYYLRSS